MYMSVLVAFSGMCCMPNPNGFKAVVTSSSPGLWLLAE